MAKQSGLHQIRGKIGEYSYYRQSGVTSGLIRQINQGMSERVKTSPEYENTRLNSAEFKIAMQAAGSLFDGVQPILRPTRSLFRTPKLAAELYKILMRSPGNWGSRYLSLTSRESICSAMHKFAKRKMSEYTGVTLGTYDSTREEINVSLHISQDLETHMSAMGADLVHFKVYQMQFYESFQETGINNELENVTIIQDVTTQVFEPGASDPGSTLTVQAKCVGPSLNLLSGRIYIPFIVVVALPIRTGNTAYQVLQDKCTFAILPDTSYTP